MAAITTVLHAIVLILVVLAMFNVIIFVHELGHFWAAKWRGLRVDRFQIWFGKPIWKKEVNGVQYGLGWIPAGGFVALPQMAPMESIEGGNKSDQALPPITPLDKIIVAFAGPLFSMLLALAAAAIVWGIGKPADVVPTTVVGYVVPDSPAEKAGFQAGDRVLTVNGEPVHSFAGTLDSVTERVVLSRGKELVFTVARPGVEAPVTLTSGFEMEESKWFQRRGLRQIGITYASAALIEATMPDSPAAVAGLEKGDRLVSVDGETLHSPIQLGRYLRAQDWKTVRLGVVKASGEQTEVELTPKKPVQPAGADPMIGVLWDASDGIDSRIVHPKPIAQVTDSLRMMWITITSVVAKDSNIGIDHLSGPVGIAKLQYQLLQTDDGWRRILAFMVLFNVNLAVLNMLPFPVLDGGHITLALLEKIVGRPVKAKPLEIVQTACALGLITLMLYVTSKDIGDGFGRGSSRSQEVIFQRD